MRSLRSYWLFPLAVSLHNLEEAIWMPRFWLERGWHTISAAEFRTLAAVVALLAIAVTLAATRTRNKLATYVFFGFCGVMLLNAFWHIGVAIDLHAYAPGVVTAAILVAPITAYLLRGFIGHGLIFTPGED